MAYTSTFAVIGMPVITFLSLLGVITPSLLSSLFPNYKLTRRLYFSFFNGLAAGLILAVGWIHSLVEADDAIAATVTDENDQAQTYPWFAFIAMMAVVITFGVDEF